MIKIFYPKTVKRLIKRYKAVSLHSIVKYNPDRFATIELYSNSDELVGVLELWEFQEKIESLEQSLNK